MDKIIIHPLRDPEEARFCAGFMIASEPWITLGLTFEQAFQRLTNPLREVRVAMVKEQVVGVLILDLTGLLNGYIQLIAVHPEWRGRGIGTQLIAFAEQRILRQSPNVFLCVSSFNHQAQKLYKRLGFLRVGELPDFVVKGHSEFLLRKTRGPLMEFKPAP